MNVTLIEIFDVLVGDEDEFSAPGAAVRGAMQAAFQADRASASRPG
jgi:hypothetical protein